MGLSLLVVEPLRGACTNAFRLHHEPIRLTAELAPDRQHGGARVAAPRRYLNAPKIPFPLEERSRRSCPAGPAKLGAPCRRRGSVAPPPNRSGAGRFPSQLSPLPRTHRSGMPLIALGVNHKRGNPGLLLSVLLSFAPEEPGDTGATTAPVAHFPRHYALFRGEGAWESNPPVRGTPPLTQF